MDIIVRDTKKLGSAIRRFRKQLKLTQGELGAKMRVRQATISTLESGEAATQVRTLMNVLAALDLEMIIRPRTKGSPQDLEDLF